MSTNFSTLRGDVEKWSLKSDDEVFFKLLFLIFTIFILIRCTRNCKSFHQMF